MTHKWAKEIKAWADGEEIESSDIYIDRELWKEVSVPSWENDRYLFRIKPQPKEPQYLYVYKDSAYTMETCSNPDNVIIKRNRVKELEHEFLAKIKLEQDDE